MDSCCGIKGSPGLVGLPWHPSLQGEVTRLKTCKKTRPSAKAGAKCPAPIRSPSRWGVLIVVGQAKGVHVRPARDRKGRLAAGGAPIRGAVVGRIEPCQGDVPISEENFLKWNFC